MRLVVLAFALCVAAPECAAQRTWLVDWYGSGDFRDLPPAVAAASPGDTIAVANPDLNRYSAVVIDKGITLMQTYNYLIQLDVQVARLPAGQRFALIGWGGVYGLRFTDCAGDIHLDRCDMFPRFDRARFSCVIERCQNVSVNASSLRDVQVRDSRVVFNRGGLTGYASPLGTFATPGLFMENSVVDVADCLVFAENVSVSSASPNPAPGVDMRGGRLVLTGRAGYALVQGGVACCDFSVTPSRVVVAPALQSTAGEIVLDPGPNLAPHGGVAHRGGATLRTETVGFLRQLTLPYPASTVLDTELYAPPGASAVVCASLPSRPLPTPFGEFWLDPAGLVVVSSGVTDSAGQMLQRFAGLNASIVTGQVLLWQGAYLDAGGLGLTVPAVTGMWTH